MQNFCDNLTRTEISNALVGARELLALLDIREGRSILDVIGTARKHFHFLEVNGDPLEEIKDGKVVTAYNVFDPEEVEWLRVDEFNRGKKGELMYCYIHTNGDDWYDGKDKSDKATHFVASTLCFDFYPIPFGSAPNDEDFVDSLTIEDCEAILKGEMEIPE